MTTWYAAASPEETDRLLAAWSDAPVENVELCNFLLDVAREQVIEYAPADALVRPGVQPVVIEHVPTAPPGIHCVYTFTRVGDVVTVTAVITSTWDMTPSASPVNVTVPEGFRMQGFWGSDDWYVNVGGSTDKIGARAEKDKTVTRTISYSTTDPLPAGSETTGNPLIDAFEGELSGAGISGVPVRLVYAQLTQAQNLWNAGRAQSDGNVGSEGYSFQPRPLDKTVRSIIRPTSGAARVF